MHGGTFAAIIKADYCVVLADSRMSTGYSIPTREKSNSKPYQSEDKCVMAFGEFMADVEALLKALSAKHLVGKTALEIAIDFLFHMHSEANRKKCGGTLLIGVNLSPTVKTLGCESRSNLPSISDDLDLYIETEGFGENRVEVSRTKYQVERHYGITSAGPTGSVEDMRNAVKETVASLEKDHCPVNIYEVADCLHEYMDENKARIVDVEDYRFMMVGAQYDGVDTPDLRLVTIDYENGVADVPLRASVSRGVGVAMADYLMRDLDYDAPAHDVAFKVADIIYRVSSKEPHVGGDIIVYIFRFGLEPEKLVFPQGDKYTLKYWEEVRVKQLLAKEIFQTARQAMRS